MDGTTVTSYNEYRFLIQICLKCAKENILVSNINTVGVVYAWEKARQLFHYIYHKIHVLWGKNGYLCFVIQRDILNQKGLCFFEEKLMVRFTIRQGVVHLTTTWRINFPESNEIQHSRPLPY